jgi:DNA-binding XRE family transcriptional regulator
MTQEQLAQAADVHPVTLARIETGKQVARSSTILALALALGLAPLDIASVVEVPRETADAVSP